MSIDSKRAIARALTLAGAKVWYVPAAGLDMPDLLARNSHGTLFGLIVETAQTPAGTCRGAHRRVAETCSGDETHRVVRKLSRVVF